MMTEYPIIKRAMPKHGRDLTSVFPFSSMEIGDCFMIPISPNDHAHLIQTRVCAASRRFGKYTEQPLFKISTRREIIDSKVVITVWRIA